MRSVFVCISISILLAGVCKAQFGSLVTLQFPINDSVVFHLDSYVGSIQWQRSGDLKSWMDIENAVDDSLLVVVKEDIYVRALVTAGNCTFYSDTSLLMIERVKDFDGNKYKTTRIGTQVWMAENLRVTHYPDGTSISQITDNVEWRSLGNNSTDDAYCWYNNDSAQYAQTYGALYSWAAAINNAYSSQGDPSGIQGVCPDGWHLPSDHESLGVSQLANKLKSTFGWSNDGSGSDEYGFTALPAGLRWGNSGNFAFLGDAAFWQSSNEAYYDSNMVAYMYLDYLGSNDFSNYISKNSGLSIRCVKGEARSSPPSQPSSPEPGDGEEKLGLIITLKWSCSDPENDKIRYDVYLDSIDGSRLVATSLGVKSYIVENLIGGKTYFWKVTARDCHGNESVSNTWHFTTKPGLVFNTVTDVEGNVYRTVVIGSQEWMAENLRTTRYPDGRPIPNIKDNNEWGALRDNSTDRAYCWWKNDSSSYYSYGAYYTWAAAMDGEKSSESSPSQVQGVCPDGWHLPSRAEWIDLLDYVHANCYNGLTAYALRSESGWANGKNGSNEFGFNAFPWGRRSTYDGGFYYFSEIGDWWSTTAIVGMDDYFNYYDIFASTLTLYYDYIGHYYLDLIWGEDYYSGTQRSEGASIRCVKGNANHPMNPPVKPFYPSPVDGANEIATAVTLGWSCTDTENDNIYYDVYLDTVDATTLLCSSLAEMATKVSLLPSTKYYWRVVARDNHGNEISGDTWTFTTAL